MYSLLRSVYRRVRTWPLIGTLVEAIRYRRFPRFSTDTTRYAEQQALLEAHGHALAGLRQGLARLQDPAWLAPMVTQAELAKQAQHLNQRIDQQRAELDHRIEFSRQETLFELRYATALQTPPAAAGHDPAPQPRTLNPAKLQAQRHANNLRLNVGCGHKPDANRLNIDRRELPGVDIVASIEALPFEAGTVAEIYSSHVLEHFPLEQLRRSILPSWTSLLRQGGQVRAVVPDAEAMLQAHANGEIDFATLRLITFGGQEYEGDFHHNMFTPDSLSQLLAEQGLVGIETVARARRNGECLEFEIVGTKP